MIGRFLKRQSYFTGMQPSFFLRNLREVPAFLHDLKQYQRMNDRSEFEARVSDMFPILTDKKDGAGSARGHYFHQDLWAARKIFERRPAGHVDIGSRIDGFIAHVLVFMPVTVVDIRSLQSDIGGLTFVKDDATEMTLAEDDSIDSLSSLHAAEHFGLGRYSDPIDPQSCFKFMHALQRVLGPGGRLYFSVPVGRERVNFNAHRVFAPKTILETFSRLQLVSFSFVGDDGCFYENVDPMKIPSSNFACGLFEFTKSRIK
jgi:hypothetical protein